MDATERLVELLGPDKEACGKVVDFDADKDRLYHFDLTANNPDLDELTFSDTNKFSLWINEKLLINKCAYGIGGYMEHRSIYARSNHFDAADEPRRLHLGVDIWALENTAIYSPLDGVVHSFRDNNNFGDYGPTIILEHNLNGVPLYSLYGHLCRESLEGLWTGQPISKNQPIARLGNSEENGNWPSHLHFQLMFDMEGMHGDYPGVCRFSEREKYLKNIPDPQIILRFPKVKYGL